MTHPSERIRPRRRIAGISAVLLPFTADGEPDLGAFEAHLGRTITAGLVPAVNMDTGSVHLLEEATRERILEITSRTTDDFVAGAFVADGPGDPFDRDAYQREIERIEERGGLPIVFPSHGLTSLPDDEVVQAHRELDCDRFLAFELGEVFSPAGRIYPLGTFRELLGIDACVGLKHSSLSRTAEWDRLAARDEIRPDFQLLTGNDLAIDMVMYGSDYLLGLSTFAPDLFAQRDRWWAEGDPRFFELNDALQFLGAFAFRPPVPAYRHSAAQFLHLRGRLDAPHPPPRSPTRPESDVEVLERALERLEEAGAAE